MMNSLMLIYAMIDDLLPCSCLYMIKAACVGPRCLRCLRRLSCLTCLSYKMLSPCILIQR